MPHMTTKNQNSHMAIPGALIRAGRGSEPVGRQGPETSPKCWYMYGPCWATAISKLMFPNKYAWYPPLTVVVSNHTPLHTNTPSRRLKYIIHVSVYNILIFKITVIIQTYSPPSSGNKFELSPSFVGRINSLIPRPGGE